MWVGQADSLTLRQRAVPGDAIASRARDMLSNTPSQPPEYLALAQAVGSRMSAAPRNLAVTFRQPQRDSCP